MDQLYGDSALSELGLGGYQPRCEKDSSDPGREKGDRCYNRLAKMHIMEMFLRFENVSKSTKINTLDGAGHYDLAWYMQYDGHKRLHYDVSVKLTALDDLENVQ